MHKSAQMSCASEFFALSSNLFAEFLASIFIRSIKSEHIIASSQFYIFRNMRKSRCTYKQTCVHLFTNFLKMLFMAELLLEWYLQFVGSLGYLCMHSMHSGTMHNPKRLGLKSSLLWHQSLTLLKPEYLKWKTYLSRIISETFFCYYFT